MEDFQNLERVKGTSVGTVKRLTSLVLLAGVVLRVVEFLVIGNIDLLLGVSSPFFPFAYYLFLELTPSQSPTSESILMIVFLEILGLHSLYLAFYVVPEQKYLIAFLSNIAVVNSQTKISSNYYASVAFIFKSFVLVVINLIEYEASYKKYLDPLVTIILSNISILFCNKFINDAEKNKHEYLEQVEITRRKTYSIIQSSPFGMGVLSVNLETEVSNQRLLDFAGCGESELLEALREFTYIPSRRFCFPDSPDSGLLPDLKRCVELDLDSQLKLGLVKTESHVLEFAVKKIRWGDHEALLLTANDAQHIIDLEKADALNKCRNSLIRSISHEMRTPLYAIMSVTEHLLDSEHSCQDLEIVEVSSQLLLCIVNDLLDYSQFINNSFQPTLAEFCLADLLSEALRLITLQAAKKGVRVISRIDPSLPSVCTSDFLRLKQVLVNLLSNALKYTSRGFIELTATFSVTHKLRVSVKDTGIGIPPEKLPLLFQIFESQSTNYFSAEGCGLGLHVSNLVAQALGAGGIEVVSEMGKGSEFSFEVPIGIDCPGEHLVVEELSGDLAVPEETSSLIEFRHLDPSKHHLCSEILLVDDNDFNRMILGTSLESLGYKFTELCNGKEALETVKQLYSAGEEVKLILMDIDMPLMNGWEATAAIRALYSSGHISSLPVIVGCSAFSSPQEIQKSYQSGMQLHLPKPITNQVLSSTVSYFLGT